MYLVCFAADSNSHRGWPCGLAGLATMVAGSGAPVAMCTDYGHFDGTATAGQGGVALYVLPDAAWSNGGVGWIRFRERRKSWIVVHSSAKPAPAVLQQRLPQPLPHRPLPSPTPR